MYDSEIENRRSIWLLYSPRTCFTYFSLRNELLTDSSNACRHRRFSLHAHSTSVYNIKMCISRRIPVPFLFDSTYKASCHSNIPWNRISSVLTFVRLRVSRRKEEEARMQKQGNIFCRVHVLLEILKELHRGNRMCILQHGEIISADFFNYFEQSTSRQRWKFHARLTRAWKSLKHSTYVLRGNILEYDYITGRILIVL